MTFYYHTLVFLVLFILFGLSLQSTPSQMASNRNLRVRIAHTINFTASLLPCPDPSCTRSFRSHHGLKRHVRSQHALVLPAPPKISQPSGSRNGPFPDPNLLASGSSRASSPSSPSSSNFDDGVGNQVKAANRDVLRSPSPESQVNDNDVHIEDDHSFRFYDDDASIHDGYSSDYDHEDRRARIDDVSDQDEDEARYHDLSEQAGTPDQDEDGAPYQYLPNEDQQARVDDAPDQEEDEAPYHYVPDEDHRARVDNASDEDEREGQYDNQPDEDRRARVDDMPDEDQCQQEKPSRVTRLYHPIINGMCS